MLVTSFTAHLRSRQGVIRGRTRLAITGSSSRRGGGSAGCRPEPPSPISALPSWQVRALQGRAPAQPGVKADPPGLLPPRGIVHVEATPLQAIPNQVKPESETDMETRINKVEFRRTLSNLLSLWSVNKYTDCDDLGDPTVP